MKSKFVLPINNYQQNGSLDLVKLRTDIEKYAKPIRELKYIDLFDSGNGIYFFLNDNDIVYIGKCSSWSFNDRLAFHLSNNPKGWMNNLMKYLAWMHSHLNESLEEFLDDNNKTQRTSCFNKAMTKMKSMRYACVSFGVASQKTIAQQITYRENLLIKEWKPLLNHITRKTNKNKATLLSIKQKLGV